MGGTMWVESEEGKGSTFHIELAVDEAEVAAGARTRTEPRRLEGKRLLVVDDNATNREIVSRQARVGNGARSSSSFPSEALALLDAGERFDVAVIDMQMPEMDGLALAREIRRVASPTPAGAPHLARSPPGRAARRRSSPPS